MKVQNYQHTKEGNYISAFDCVVYGHIEMTWKEWMEASKYLMQATKDTFYRNMLKEDIIRKDKYLELYNQKRITWRNVRVTATQLLFKKYNLPRYKMQNYVIKIITN